MTHRMQLTSLAGIALLAAACGASTPSHELVSARHVVQQAKQGPAAEANPKGIHEAEQELERAEAAHADHAGSFREKDHAYVAMRKAQLAVAQGNERLAKQSVDEANDRYRTSLERSAKALSSRTNQYSEDLAAARRELSDVRTELGQTDANLTEKTRELESKEAALKQRVNELKQARAARQEAEARAQQALKDLEELASVRDDAGRLTISLSGAVLFKTASSDLLGMAKRRLDTVADAIEGYEAKEIVVEGHTDARGTEAYNDELSQKRAESVRRYLIEHGLPASRVRAVGKGESDPIASNDTPEGRANNRRVEIIVDHDGAKSSSTTEKPQQSSASSNSEASSKPTAATTE